MTKKDMKFLRCLHFMIFENDQEEKRFAGNHSFPDEAARAKNWRYIEDRQYKSGILEGILDAYIKNIID